MKKILNSKFVIRNSQAGMTYVELIVVLGIFAVMSSIVMYNHGEFQAKVDVKNLASEIALKIVEAQKSAVNGLLPLGGYDPEIWKPSYGVYFDLSSNNKTFIYFADLDNDSTYNETPIDTVPITKGNYIDSIYGYSSESDPISLDESLATIFKRPDSSAIFTDSNGSDLLSVYNFSFIQINLKSPKEAKAVIKIYPSGRVQVD